MHARLLDSLFSIALSLSDLTVPCSRSSWNFLGPVALFSPHHLHERHRLSMLFYAIVLTYTVHCFPRGHATFCRYSRCLTLFQFRLVYFPPAISCAHAFRSSFHLLFFISLPVSLESLLHPLLMEAFPCFDSCMSEETYRATRLPIILHSVHIFFVTPVPLVYHSLLPSNLLVFFLLLIALSPIT